MSAAKTPEPATVGFPFSGLKPGVKYIYTRTEWPKPQVGTQHRTLQHTAEVKEITFKAKTGNLFTEQQIQLGGEGRFYQLKELPTNATFTEV